MSAAAELPADAPQTLSVTHGTAETVTLTYTAPNRCLMPRARARRWKPLSTCPKSWKPR